MPENCAVVSKSAYFTHDRSRMTHIPGNIDNFLKLRYRIISGPAPWMTAQQTADGKIKPLERAPFAERLERILGTSWREAACRRRVRRYALAVKCDKDNEREYRDLPHDFSELAAVSLICRLAHYSEISTTLLSAAADLTARRAAIALREEVTASCTAEKSSTSFVL